MTDREAEEGREWFAEGLRFQCTQCGNCCTGPPGWVHFDEPEGRRMADGLGLTEPEFYGQYAHKVGGRWSLKERRTAHGYDCVFLDRTTRPGKALCGIYETRPGQCRTWPFWPENLVTKSAWDAARRRTPCPGMDQGRLVTAQQIRIRRDETE